MRFVMSYAIQPTRFLEHTLWCARLSQPAICMQTCSVWPQWSCPQASLCARTATCMSRLGLQSCAREAPRKGDPSKDAMPWSSPFLLCAGHPMAHCVSLSFTQSSSSTSQHGRQCISFLRPKTSGDCGTTVGDHQYTQVNSLRHGSTKATGVHRYLDAPEADYG